MEDVGKESSMVSLVSKLVIVTEVVITDLEFVAVVSDVEISGVSEDVVYGKLPR